MAARRGSPLGARWLGRRLREVREHAGLSLREVGARVQRDASSMSRMEAGIHPARMPDVLAYVDICGAAEHRDDLLVLARDVWQGGWWHRHAEHIPGTLADRIWLEARARAIHGFAGLVLPDLLQTRRYAEAVLRPDHETAVARQVDVRLERQKILHGGVAYAVVIDESALRRMVGGAPTMREQLDRLAEAAAEPAVQIRVLPYAAGAPASPVGRFDVLDLPSPYPRVAVVAGPTGEDVYVAAADAEPFVAVYERLRADALDERDSAALIAAVRREFDAATDTGTGTGVA